GQEKRASKKQGGILKKRGLHGKKFVRPSETGLGGEKKKQWPPQCCLSQSFLCGVLLLATAGSTLMLTQTGQKERPSAVYSTVVSIVHKRGQRESSSCWAFGACQHASQSSGRR
ncbi:hypothetical protein XENORESO_012591, partial [Xenotaenia resolanae]